MISSNDSVEIGGIAVYNHGTIINSSFEMPSTINSELEHTGLYSSTSSASHSAIVGGIVVYNGSSRDEISGIISESNFNGDISGNMIGGIAYESYGNIEKCYSNGNAYIASNDGRAIEYGGIVGRLFGKSAIKYSYSQLIVNALVTSATSGSVGGIVGNYDTNSLKANPSTVIGCYAVLDVTFSVTNSSVNVYAVMPGNEKVTCEDNVVYSKVTFTLNSGASANVVTDITALNNAVANVKENGISVYKTDNKDGEGNSDYPTFA